MNEFTVYVCDQLIGWMDTNQCLVPDNFTRSTRHVEKLWIRVYG